MTKDEKQQNDFSHLPAKKQEEILARIALSTKRYQKVKEKYTLQQEKKTAFRKACHEGNEYLKRLKEGYFWDAFGMDKGFMISFVMPRSGTNISHKRPGFVKCKFAYSIKAPTDEFKKHVSTGLCGHRLQNDTNNWTIGVQIPKIFLLGNDGELRSVIVSILALRMISESPEVPQRVINRILGDSERKYKAALKLQDE